MTAVPSAEVVGQDRRGPTPGRTGMPWRSPLGPARQKSAQLFQSPAARSGLGQRHAPCAGCKFKTVLSLVGREGGLETQGDMLGLQNSFSVPMTPDQSAPRTSKG